MIRRRQLFRHEPHNVIYGDCHRTAIACLLDMEPWQVPHFTQLAHTTPGYDWESGVAAFLALGVAFFLVAVLGFLGAAAFLGLVTFLVTVFLGAWNYNLRQIT